MSKLFKTSSHSQTNVYEQVAAAACDEGSSGRRKDDSNLIQLFSSLRMCNILGTNKDEKDVRAFDHSGKRTRRGWADALRVERLKNKYCAQSALRRPIHEDPGPYMHV